MAPERHKRIIALIDETLDSYDMWLARERRAPNRATPDPVASPQAT